MSANGAVMATPWQTSEVQTLAKARRLHFCHRDEIALLHCAMPEPVNPKPATEDPLLEALRSIQAAASEYPGGLLAALKSADSSVKSDATFRVHDLSVGLADIVIKDSRFLGDVVRMVAWVDGASAFYPMFVGQALVRRLLELDSPEETIRWLIKVVHTSEADGRMITLVRGAPVTASVELTPRLKLVPLSDLPDSPQKQLMTSIDFGPRPTVTGMLDWEPPSSALVISYPKHPFLVGQEDPLSTLYFADSDLVADAILALTIVGPRIVMHAVNWFNFDDPDLETARRGVSFGSRIVEVIPNQRLEAFPPLDDAMARQAVRAFLSLEGRVKDKVRIALTRLRLALSRHSVGDKALEVAIAFETLLEDGGNAEMTHKIKVRTARLIGGSAEERERNAAIVGKTYEVRSSLVHQGHVDRSKSLKLRKGEAGVAADKVVALAIDVCAKLIATILRRQDIPVWTSFDVAEHTGTE